MLDGNLFEPPQRRQTPTAPARGTATTTRGRVRIFEAASTLPRDARTERAIAAPLQRRSSVAGAPPRAARPSSSTGRLRGLRSARVAPLAAATLVVAVGGTAVCLQRATDPRAHDIAHSPRPAAPATAAHRERPASDGGRASLDRRHSHTTSRGGRTRRPEARRRETPARREARRRARRATSPTRAARVEPAPRRIRPQAAPSSPSRAAATPPSTASPTTASAPPATQPEPASATPPTPTSSAPAAGAARSASAASAAPSPDAREFGIE